MKSMLTASVLVLLFGALYGTPATAQSGRRAAGPLDPNTSTSEQLVTLAGVDATLAAAIVKGRPYADMLAVNAVVAGHLNEAQRKALYEKLFLPINLNTATDAEILLVPGVGARMLREFKEYRPWRSIEQFRREIGKYVSDEEVARLERYVAIR